MDFIGNHISFFKKAEALFHLAPNNAARRKFIDLAEFGDLALPNSCFVNYDLKAIEFMRQLISSRIDTQLEIYRGLKESLDRRPTLSEFYMGGGAVTSVRSEHGQWLKFVDSESDLSSDEVAVLTAYEHFFKEIEITSMNKSFKMILLEAYIELDGFVTPVTIRNLSEKSFEVIQRKLQLQPDLPEHFQNIHSLDQTLLNLWVTYWKKNPIAAWKDRKNIEGQFYFKISDDVFEFVHSIDADIYEVFCELLQELINFKLSTYESRITITKPTALAAIFNNSVGIPFFTDLKIACGHFATSSHDTDNLDYRVLPLQYGKLDPEKHFIAVAKGDSMNGGKNPIKNGDFLLLEFIGSNSAGSISNQILAIENQDATGDDQYLLRYIKKRTDGVYDLIAKNTDYPVFQSNDQMKTFARLISVISPLDLALHQEFMREDIPPLFGHEFNSGAWRVGHVSIKDSNDQYLFVTLNKQGKAQEHQYHDYFIDEQNFHWQSQNDTSPIKNKGKKIIDHQRNGSNFYLFVRKNKLRGKKGAPFTYCGKLNYKKHSGEKPMSVEWDMETSLSEDLFAHFNI